jgi:hypothetical protein
MKRFDSQIIRICQELVPLFTGKSTKKSLCDEVRTSKALNCCVGCVAMRYVPKNNGQPLLPPGRRTRAERRRELVILLEKLLKQRRHRKRLPTPKRRAQLAARTRHQDALDCALSQCFGYDGRVATTEEIMMLNEVGYVKEDGRLTADGVRRRRHLLEKTQ